MNDTTMLRHQNWMWALRREMGWPTFKPINDCIAWASGRTMDVELGMELARLATASRKDMVFSCWASVGAAEPVGYILALRELFAVDIVDRCVAYTADEEAPLLLVSTRRDEHFAVHSRGLLERREGKPANLGKGRKLAVKRLRATAATMGDRLCADNRWVPTGGDWIEPVMPPMETVVRFN